MYVIKNMYKYIYIYISYIKYHISYTISTPTISGFATSPLFFFAKASRPAPRPGPPRRPRRSGCAGRCRAG